MQRTCHELTHFEIRKRFIWPVCLSQPTSIFDCGVYIIQSSMQAVLNQEKVGLIYMEQVILYLECIFFNAKMAIEHQVTGNKQSILRVAHV